MPVLLDGELCVLRLRPHMLRDELLDTNDLPSTRLRHPTSTVEEIEILQRVHAEWCDGDPIALLTPYACARLPQRYACSNFLACSR